MCPVASALDVADVYSSTDWYLSAKLSRPRTVFLLQDAFARAAAQDYLSALRTSGYLCIYRYVHLPT